MFGECSDVSKVMSVPCHGHCVARSNMLHVFMFMSITSTQIYVYIYIYNLSYVTV